MPIGWIMLAGLLGGLPSAFHDDLLSTREPDGSPTPTPVDGADPGAIYRGRAAAVVAIAVPDGQGSGTFIRPDGFIVTCAHVVGDAQRVQVTTQSGAHHEGRLLAADPVLDLAIVKVDVAEPVPWIEIGGPLAVGERVVAIGHPKGFGWSMNEGIVSNLFSASMIQTQLPLNPGNSGGPLLDRSGRLVGVVAQGDPAAQSLNWSLSSRAVKRFLVRHASVFPKASVVVDAKPDGARIEIDGVEIGRAPRAEALVGAGPHRIRVVAEEVETSTSIVVLQRSAVRLALVARPRGTLAVTGDSVEVFVDSLAVGRTPVTLDLAAGSHVVVGRKPGTRETRTQVDVRPAEESCVRLEHPESRGFLSVETEPAGALVIVDGERIGATPVTRWSVSPGRHVVDVRADDGARRTVVDVAHDGHRVLTFDLRPPTDPSIPVPSPVVPRDRSSARRRTGWRIAAGGILVGALSVGVLVRDDRPAARSAATAGLVVGAGGLIVGRSIAW